MNNLINTIKTDERGSIFDNVLIRVGFGVAAFAFFLPVLIQVIPSGPSVPPGLSDSFLTLFEYMFRFDFLVPITLLINLFRIALFIEFAFLSIYFFQWLFSYFSSLKSS